MLNRSIIAVLLALFCAGCGIQLTENEATTPAFQIITATLLPSSTPPPTEATHSEVPLPLASTQPPTIVPVEGITTTQINVRADPSTASEVLGILPANTTVQIVGVDPGENWWQIRYPETGVAGEENEGKGWVTAEYVTTASEPEVPVIGGGSNSDNPNAPLAPLAVIQQQLNVRSGPGTSFNSLGILNPQDVVALIGKDANGAWLQIEYSAGPEGKGWINAAFAQAHGVENLPIVTEAGRVIGTSTPEATALPPTPTVVPAPNDSDSAQAPAINVTFTASGTHSLQFTSDISSPTGDRDDWIQFTPFTSRVILELTCTGNGLLTVELLQNSQPITNWKIISCGESQSVETQVGPTYQLHIQARASGELHYSRFTLKVRSMP